MAALSLVIVGLAVRFSAETARQQPAVDRPGRALKRPQDRAPQAAEETWLGGGGGGTTGGSGSSVSWKVNVLPGRTQRHGIGVVVAVQGRNC